MSSHDPFNKTTAADLIDNVGSYDGWTDRVQDMISEYDDETLSDRTKFLAAFFRDMTAPMEQAFPSAQAVMVDHALACFELLS